MATVPDFWRLAQRGQERRIPAAFQRPFDRGAVEVRAVALNLNLNRCRDRPGTAGDLGVGAERFRRTGVAGVGVCAAAGDNASATRPIKSTDGTRTGTSLRNIRPNTAGAFGWLWHSLPTAGRERLAVVVPGREEEQIALDLPVAQPAGRQRARRRRADGLPRQHVAERPVLQVDDRPPIGRDRAVARSRCRRPVSRSADFSSARISIRRLPNSS